MTGLVRAIIDAVCTAAKLDPSELLAGGRSTDRVRRVRDAITFLLVHDLGLSTVETSRFLNLKARTQIRDAVQRAWVRLEGSELATLAMIIAGRKALEPPPVRSSATIAG